MVSFASVIVHVIHQLHAFRGEAKHQPPVGLHGHGVMPLAVAAQGMQPPTWARQVLRACGDVQCREHVAQPLGVHGLNPLAAPCLEESLQAFVAEGLDHVAVNS